MNTSQKPTQKTTTKPQPIDKEEIKVKDVLVKKEDFNDDVVDIKNDKDANKSAFKLSKYFNKAAAKAFFENFALPHAKAKLDMLL